jgi:RNA polymerase sigma-70 factor (ECF subfamily)
MGLFRVLADGSSSEGGMEDAISVRAFAMQTEEEIDDARVAAAAKRDAHAFGVLYERYYGRVYRYVYHRVDGVADAEDITALVFMKALEALPSYQPGPNGFAPWLFRITRNAVVDHYRRRKRHDGIDAIEHETGDDPVVDVLHQERRDELHRLIQHLSDEQRDVILLRYSADLTFGEIAATMKKKEPAIRMLLHRGLRKLKTVMDDERI